MLTVPTVPETWRLPVTFVWGLVSGTMTRLVPGVGFWTGLLVVTTAGLAGVGATSGFLVGATTGFRVGFGVGFEAIGRG